MRWLLLALGNPVVVLATADFDPDEAGDAAAELVPPPIDSELVASAIATSIVDAGHVAVWDDIDDDGQYDLGVDRCIAANYLRNDVLINASAPTHLSVGISLGHWLVDVDVQPPLEFQVLPEDSPVVAEFAGTDSCPAVDACAQSGDFTSCLRPLSGSDTNYCFGHSCHVWGCGEARCNSSGGWFAPLAPGRDFGNATGLQRVVTDPGSGLQWTGAAERTSWADAVAHCRQLGAVLRADWRLPDVHEVASIIDFEATPATVDADAFPDPDQAEGDVDIWTASVHPVDSSKALAARYHGGSIRPVDKQAFGYARCVRGDVRAQANQPRFERTGDQATDWVRDTVTGLRWRLYAPNAMPEGLWPMPAECQPPTVHQWMTIVTARPSPIGLDPWAFPDLPSGRYWADDSPPGGRLLWSILLDGSDDRLTVEAVPPADNLFLMCVDAEDS